MKTIVVTSGQSYTDIDALACAMAYSELLSLEGRKTEVVLPGPLNHSVTETIKSWNLDIKTKPTDSDFNSVIVDASNLESFAIFVTEESIVEIYDHHYGFQDYWDTKLKNNSHIEPIGACATLIWEEFKKRGYRESISIKSANLLLTAIISNTLNFGAQITNQRDHTAASELGTRSNLPKNWIITYFQDQEKTVWENVHQSILGDTKIIKVPALKFPIVIAQIELWNSKNYLIDNQIEIRKIMEKFGYSHWIATLPSISEKINYMYTEDLETQKIFSDIINTIWVNNIGTTNNLWLRKEIRKKLDEYDIYQ